MRYKQTEKQRLDWVDIGRGLAITLMVAGHTSLPTSIQNWIFSFHMPFFFFISGVLSTPLKTYDAKGYRTFIKRKSQSLLVPFIIYSVISIIVYPLYGDMPVSIYVINVIQEGWGGLALWFIPVFFFAVILSRICITTRKSAILSCFILISIGWALAKNSIFMPWNLSTIPFATCYMILGYLMKDIILTIASLKINIKSIGIISATFLISFTISQFFRLDMSSNMILPVTPILVASLSGIILLISISAILSYNKFCSKTIQYIGRHAFEVLAFSQVIILIINKNFAFGIILKYTILATSLYIIFIRDYITFLNKKHKNKQAII